MPEAVAAPRAQTAFSIEAKAGAQEPGAPHLRQNFVWTVAANVVYAACQWGMLALLAKLCSPAEVGSFALGLALTAPVILFSNLQLRAVQATDADQRFTFSEYLTLRLWTTILALAAIAMVALVLRSHSFPSVVVLVLGLAKSVESISDVFHGLLQAEERMAVIARSLILRGLLSLVLMSVAVNIWPTAQAASAAWLTAFVVMLVAYDWPAVAGRPASTVRRATWSRLRSLAVHALPLGLVQGLVSLSANIPRYELERTAGLSELGIYSALASLVVLGQTFVSALGNVLSPRLARHYTLGDLPSVRRMLAQMGGAALLLGTCGTVVAALAGRPLLALLFRPEYSDHAAVLTVVMMGATAAYCAWSLGFGLTAAGLLREQVPLLGVVCLTAWAAARILVTRYGATGAAASLAIAMTVQAVGAYVILARAMNRRTSS